MHWCTDAILLRCISMLIGNGLHGGTYMEERNKRITVSLTEALYEALRKYAFDYNISLSTALSNLCHDGLIQNEYMASNRTKQSRDGK